MTEEKTKYLVGPEDVKEVALCTIPEARNRKNKHGRNVSTLKRLHLVVSPWKVTHKKQR